MDRKYKVGGYVKLAKLWERSKDAAVAYHSSYYAEKFRKVCMNCWILPMCRRISENMLQIIRFM